MEGLLEGGDEKRVDACGRKGGVAGRPTLVPYKLTAETATLEPPWNGVIQVVTALAIYRLRLPRASNICFQPQEPCPSPSLHAEHSSIH